jgi:hypothetical protein
MSPSWARADDEAIARTKKELQPRPVTLKATAMPLSAALAELSRQTGNQVADRRHARTDLKLKLDLERSTFWPALEAIAKAAQCGISTYQADGQVALVDSPSRPLSTTYEGIFRVTAREVSAARNDEAGTHLCTVTLDLAWEPRFVPLYLEVGPVQAVFTADGQGKEHHAKSPGQGKMSVGGRNAVEFPLRLAAPPRSSLKIKSLDGELRLTGPGKMLTFTFGPVQAVKKGDSPIQETQEGVRVSLAQVKTASRLWSIEVHISNPPGNPQFESYQSWRDNNYIALTKGAGPNAMIWQPRSGGYQVNKETAAGAEITYFFDFPAKENKGPLADWTLVYRTPGQIVDIQVPLALKDLPLP